MADPIVQNPYDPQRYPLLIVISGPSGVGKDSVVQELKKRDYPFHFVVTATSRPPRPDEVHGVDYIFVSEEEFEEMIQEDELLEHAIVYDQHKGIPKEQVRRALASGKDVIMRLDVQGAATVRTIVPEAVLVFLSVSTEEELLARLRQRDTDSEEQIQRRLRLARDEMKRVREFDYLVMNHHCRLDKAVDRIIAIIESEHCRAKPRRVTL